MFVPLMLLLVSLAGVVVAFALPGWSDLLLLSGPSALASAYLLLRAFLARPKRDQVILDGSNVMHWRDGKPDIETVREVLDLAAARGMTPGVVFDANAGYLLFDKYAGDRAFAHFLKLRPDRVLVVPKGTPADPTILTAARDLGARVISNDRFRDWAEDFPELAMPGHLIRGGYRDGALWLDTDVPPVP
jgi:hypothetical protein